MKLEEAMELADTLDGADVLSLTIEALQCLRDEVRRLQKSSVEDAVEKIKSKAIAMMEHDFRQWTGHEPENDDREKWVLTLVQLLGENQKWVAEIGDDPKFMVYRTDQHERLEGVLAQMRKDLT
jgi:hypothetical protein